MIEVKREDFSRHEMSVRVVVTHAGIFHADAVLGTVILEKALG